MLKMLFLFGQTQFKSHSTSLYILDTFIPSSNKTLYRIWVLFH